MNLIPFQYSVFFEKFEEKKGKQVIYRDHFMSKNEIERCIRLLISEMERCSHRICSPLHLPEHLMQFKSEKKWI